MTEIEPVYFVEYGMQWVTQRWVDADGVVCCENTHPVYDEAGNPLPETPAV